MDPDGLGPSNSCDDESSEDDVMADMGFMFDSEQAVVCKSLIFQRSVGENACNSGIATLFKVYVELESIDDDPGAVQSGHYLWPASPALAQHLVQLDTSSLLGGKNAIRVVELGAGCGLGGCVAMQLPGVESVMLTDHDPGCLDRARTNVQKTKVKLLQEKADLSGLDVDMSFELLSWGDTENAENLLSKQEIDGFHLVIGSDLIYDVGVVGPLFQTMVQLLLKDVDGACVLMTQSFSYDTQTEEAIDELCVSLNLVRSILSCALTDGGIRLQKFSFTTSTNADT